MPVSKDDRHEVLVLREFAEVGRVGTDGGEVGLGRGRDLEAGQALELAEVKAEDGGHGYVAPSGSSPGVTTLKDTALEGNTRLT